MSRRIANLQLVFLLAAGFLKAATISSLAQDEPFPCGELQPSAVAGLITPSASARPLTAAAGDVVRFAWQAPGKEWQACKSPRYLIASLPADVRFTGDRFFALPPGVAGPFGIEWDEDRMRIFIPLSVGPDPQGPVEFGVRFLKVGAAEL